MPAKAETTTTGVSASRARDEVRQRPDALGGADGGPAELHDDHGRRSRAFSSSAFRMAAPAAPRMVLWTSASSLQVEDAVGADAAHRHRHPALAVAVQPRLRPVGLGRARGWARSGAVGSSRSCGSPRNSASARAASSGEAFFLSFTNSGHGVAVGDRHAVDRGRDREGRHLERAAGEAAEDAPRLGLDLLLLAAADVGDRRCRRCPARPRRDSRRPRAPAASPPPPTRRRSAAAAGPGPWPSPTTLQLGLVTM